MLLLLQLAEVAVMVVADLAAGVGRVKDVARGRFDGILRRGRGSET